MMEVKLIQAAKTGKFKTVRLWVDGATVYREWGIRGGKLQTTADTKKGVNIGKANEKSPDTVAIEAFDRLKHDFLWDGYEEVDDFDSYRGMSYAKKMEATLKGFNFDAPPTFFTVSKPEKKVSVVEVAKLLRLDVLRVFVKYNGFCYVATRGEGDAHIFSRKWDDHSAKFPEMVKTLTAAMPVNSMWVCEMYNDDPSKTHMENFNIMQSVSKSDVSGDKVVGDLTKTAKLLEANNIRLAVFAQVAELGVFIEEVDEILKRGASLPAASSTSLFHRPDELQYKELIGWQPVQCVGRFTQAEFDQSVAQAEKLIELCFSVKELEGYVGYDTKGSIAFSIDGEPERAGTFKLKASEEIEVVATGYQEGTGDRQGKIGSLKISEYKDGQEIDRGTVGSGITDAMADPALWTFPCVIEMKYGARQVKTGNFQFPVFIKVHEDKSVADLQK
jgi:hypothetical protein